MGNNFPKDHVNVDDLNVDIANLPVERKAELFDALMNQDRIRILGWAQLGNPNYQHIGMEMWTHYLADSPELHETVEKNKQILHHYLATYADRGK